MIETTQTEYKPTSVSAPGETLLDILHDRGLTQRELATRTKRPLKTINELIKGKIALTPETAIQLERTLGVPASFWLNREAKFREWQARELEKDDMKSQTKWLSQIPLAHMIKERWVERAKSRTEQVQRCLEFFGVASVPAWKQACSAPVAEFKMSNTTKKTGSIAAWLRQGERLGEKAQCEPYNADRFRAALTSARTQTSEADSGVVGERLRQLCNQCGVAVIILPAPPGCPASGATVWMRPDKALLLLTVRFRTNDHFWFTFFHEAAHILLHSKKEVFIDDGADDTARDKEAEANAFAADLLIPKEHEPRLRTLQMKAEIVAFAREIGVAPGIVVGRLQRERIVRWSAFNDLKVSYDATALAKEA